jgi:hypothetical protein
VDQRKPQLRVGEEAAVAGDAQVREPAQLHVAAEVEVVGIVARRVEAATAEGEQRRRAAEPQVLAQVGVDVVRWRKPPIGAPR